MMISRVLCAAAILIGTGSPLLAAAKDDSAARMLDQIKYLASDELEGRGIGTDGLNKAAEFVREQFANAGLDVTKVNGGAFQTFPQVTGTTLGDKNELVLKGADGETLTLKIKEQFQVCSFGSSGNFDTELVFCGYGIDHKQYNDFDGIELKGKIAVIVRRNPQQGNKKSPFAGVHGGVSRHAALTTKLSNAYRKGAAAVIFVNDPYTAKSEKATLESQIKDANNKIAEYGKQLNADAQPDDAKREELKKKTAAQRRRLATLKKRLQEYNGDPLMKFGYGGNAREKGIPVFHLSKEVSNKLLKASMGKTLAQIENEIDKDLKPQSQVLKGWKAVGTATVHQTKTEVKNVIGVLEGEGPLANETIVIGAHYDHVGMGQRGFSPGAGKEVHNGADDNASGTVSLIELAKRFAGKKGKPARRLVFIAFTAEEIGLIGSAYYCKNPIFPLKDTVAMFNMDMVGRMRGEKLTVFGTGTAKRWKPLLDSMGDEFSIKLTYKPEGFGPSDHSSFYGKKIPVLHLFTDTHRDYHKPTDDWDKINVPGMVRVVDMLEKIVEQTLEEKARPRYIQIAGRANVNRGGSRPYFGSIPDFGTEVEGYPIQGVAPGSPADKAGMKAGDVIIKLGKQKIGSLNDFDLALRKFKSGDLAEVTVKRDGKEVKLNVTLGKPK